MKRLLVLLGVAAFGCGDSDSSASHGGLDTTPEGPASSVDHAPVDPSKLPITSASPQRLQIQQVRLSLPIAMGKDQGGNDISWLLANGKNGLDENSDTLGEADYIVITQEILDPNPLYLKFMDDAARSVCDQALTADYAKTAMTDRVLLRYSDKPDTVKSNASGIDKNLRYLKLRMHAVKVADTDTTTIAPLRTLFQTTVDAFAAGGTASESDVKEGWRGVCVALLTAPEFHIY